RNNAGCLLSPAAFHRRHITGPEGQPFGTVQAHIPGGIALVQLHIVVAATPDHHQIRTSG
ncbi:MAG: hypothetical protein O7A69_06600, partial [SAR324 cluster bacterium]|nr:hypothetical protein [SAR324 cluster bacterium]